MWAVSDRFLQAITQSHTIGTTATLTLPSGTTTLDVVSGTITVQSDQIVRRTANLVISGDTDLYQAVSTPGAIITVEHGVVFDSSGGDREYVPVITGELSSAATDLGSGQVQINLADYGQRITAANFIAAQHPAATADRTTVVAAVVTSAVTSTTVTDLSTNTSTIGAGQTWGTDRAGMITQLLTDAAAEGYFLPDGNYRIRDIPTTSDPSVWVFKTGDGGTVTAFTRTRPLDKLYNTVVVTPTDLGGKQTWTRVVKQITDTTNPRHPTYIGVRPYAWQSPTIMSAATATKVATALLNKVQGSTETLSLGAISNPALDAGDVIRASNPTPEGVEIITHLIDSLSIDLASGEMTVNTRASVETFS